MKFSSTLSWCVFISEDLKTPKRRWVNSIISFLQWRRISFLLGCKDTQARTHATTHTVPCGEYESNVILKFLLLFIITCNPSLQRLRQEDHRFPLRMDYIIRLYLAKQLEAWHMLIISFEMWKPKDGVELSMRVARDKDSCSPGLFRLPSFLLSSARILVNVVPGTGLLVNENIYVAY